MGLENSRIHLIIDIPDDREQSCMIEACIEKIRNALSPEQIKIWEARISDDTHLTAEEAAAYLLYLSYQYLYLLHSPLSSVVSSMLHLQEHLFSQAEQAPLSARSLDQTFIANLLSLQNAKITNPFITDHALRIIDSQYSSLTLESLALQLNVSHSYLCRILSKDTGHSFSELLHYRRILAAASHFINGPASISMEALSIRLGYTSLHYFHRVFKRYTKLTPVTSKKLLREISASHTPPPPPDFPPL